ncbi:metallophosphoesterase family protein [Manganibacter manganicus]|uniref:Metallophosphoesterase n=1 Tax=Manganibacter manganicus TaxID=1873176 RepID=A0A1V8RVL9_9HYPH|nr:metallophosphoesterase [Pseudaminobacter manganicus]OQM77222.1 metallophosphoesterase [Pseudaminobacter manganicus]
MTRILQISDTHLSPTKRHFHDNWRPLCDWIARQNADLIIHTGDVTVDGADVEEDMRYCSALLRTLDVPVLCVPGNHDVGEPKHRHQPVNTKRLERWRRHFGPDHWFHDVENWRLIGLDSMLFGSDEPAEAEQFEWLEQTMHDADGRRIAWFTHRPLFIERPDEGDVGYWAPPPAPRARLLETVHDHNVSLIASGHLHKARDVSLGEVRLIWGPSSGFVVGATLQPANMAGEARLGAVVYEFKGSGFTVEFADIPGLAPFRIDDVLHEVYPPHETA